MRVANRIYSLHLQSFDQVIYTYQKVFKFLIDYYDGFKQLTFKNINKLIDTIFMTKLH